MSTIVVVRKGRHAGFDACAEFDDASDLPVIMQTLEQIT